MGNKTMWDILAVNDNNAKENSTSDFNRTYLPKDYILWLANEKLYDINKPIIIIFILLILFGLFGNFLVIYIFGFRLKKSTAHTYITSISTFDSLTCLFLIYEVFDKRFPMYSGNFPEICKLVRCLEVFVNGCSSLIMCGISVDRYYAVYTPFKRIAIRTVRKSILGMVIAMIILSWPMVLFHGPETVKTIYPSITGRDCADDDNFKGSVYPGIYFPIVFVIIISTIIVTVAMYCLVFIKIFKWKHSTIGESVPSVSGNLRKSSAPTFRKSSNFSTASVIYRKSSKALGHRKGKLKDEEQNPYKDTSRSQPETHSTKKRFPIKLQTDAMAKDEMLSIRTKSISFPTIHSNNNTNKQNPRVLNLRKEHERTKEKTSTRNSYRNKRLSRRGSTRDRAGLSSTTIMFSLTALVYVLCYLPTIIVECINSISSIKEEELSIPIRKVLAVCNSAFFINVAFNPIIYGVFNKFFRDEVRDIILGTRGRWSV